MDTDKDKLDSAETAMVREGSVLVFTGKFDEPITTDMVNQLKEELEWAIFDNNCGKASD